MIRQAARSDSNVLITGETGTGKELVARAIHDDGIRKDKPFISLNSSAIPKELIESELFGHEKGAFTGANSRKKGIFESADKGTLFLDEIGEMSLDAQAKLLRVIEYGDFMRVGGSEYIKVDTRIIAATNRDLEKACKEGRFREDLYYRINVFHIKLPPLRDRREDIPLLINYFIEKTSKSMDRRFTLTEPANELLNCYSWPGNIRQLQNAIEVAISRAEGEIIHSWDLPEEILKTSESNEDTERKMIIEAYRASNGNATEAANMLGMPRSTFYNKAREQYGIDLNSIKNELKKHS